MWCGARRAAIGFCLVWTVVTIVASDVSLRYREGIWTGFRFDAELGWYPVANQRDVLMESKDGTYRVSTDTLGHRNEIVYPRDRRLSVVLQGDSNAFGFGLKLDDTFCAVFTRASGEACFNLGVPGYDTQHYYFQFEAITRRFAVRTRIILFNVGNDFTLSALESPYLIPRPYLFREGGATKTPLRNFLPHSRSRCMDIISFCHTANSTTGWPQYRPDATGVAQCRNGWRNSDYRRSPSSFSILASWNSTTASSTRSGSRSGSA